MVVWIVCIEECNSFQIYNVVFSCICQNLIVAFDDKGLLVEGTNNPVSTLNASQSITDTYNIVFEMAWRSAKS